MKAFTNCFLILSMALTGCSNNGVSYQLKLPENDTLSKHGYEVEFTFFKDSTYSVVSRNSNTYDSLFLSGHWSGTLQEDSLISMFPKHGGFHFYLSIADGKVVKVD